VLPPFKDIFADFRTTLPALTEFVIAAGDIYPWFFAVGWGIVLLIALTDFIAHLVGARGIPWLSLLSYVPVLGRVLRANLLARWLDAFRIGIISGLDLPRALALAANATGEPALIRDVGVINEQLRRGLALTSFASRHIPATVTAAIELASSTGSGAELPHIIRSLSHMYEQQAEHRLRILPSILTPLLIILIACGVSVTVASMFLPFVKLIQSVSGGG